MMILLLLLLLSIVMMMMMMLMIMMMMMTMMIKMIIMITTVIIKVMMMMVADCFNLLMYNCALPICIRNHSNSIFVSKLCQPVCEGFIPVSRADAMAPATDEAPAADSGRS